MTLTPQHVNSAREVCCLLLRVVAFGMVFWFGFDVLQQVLVGIQGLNAAQFYKWPQPREALLKVAIGVGIGLMSARLARWIVVFPEMDETSRQSIWMRVVVRWTIRAAGVAWATWFIHGLAVVLLYAVLNSTGTGNSQYALNFVLRHAPAVAAMLILSFLIDRQLSTWLAPCADGNCPRCGHPPTPGGGGTCPECGLEGVTSDSAG